MRHLLSWLRNLLMQSPHRADVDQEEALQQWRANLPKRLALWEHQAIKREAKGRYYDPVVGYRVRD